MALQHAASAAPATDDAPQQQDPADDEAAGDFANHLAFGDDAVPANLLIFAAHPPIFVSASHNDAASIPPYLPPAARPPKI